jgi:hypothetical protein
VKFLNGNGAGEGNHVPFQSTVLETIKTSNISCPESHVHIPSLLKLIFTIKKSFSE